MSVILSAVWTYSGMASISVYAPATVVCERKKCNRDKTCGVVTTGFGADLR